MKSIIAVGEIIGHVVTGETYLEDMFFVDGNVLDGLPVAAEIRRDEESDTYSVILDLPCGTKEEAEELLNELLVAAGRNIR